MYTVFAFSFFLYGNYVRFSRKWWHYPLVALLPDRRLYPWSLPLLPWSWRHLTSRSGTAKRYRSWKYFFPSCCELYDIEILEFFHELSEILGIVNSGVLEMYHVFQVNRYTWNICKIMRKQEQSLPSVNVLIPVGCRGFAGSLSDLSEFNDRSRSQKDASKATRVRIMDTLGVENMWQKNREFYSGHRHLISWRPPFALRPRCQCPLKGTVDLQPCYWWIVIHGVESTFCCGSKDIFCFMHWTPLDWIVDIWVAETSSATARFLASMFVFYV